MRKRREINAFSISFLDLLSGALGAVIILYVAIPKNKPMAAGPKTDIVAEILKKDLQESRNEVQQLKNQLAELQKTPVVENKETTDSGTNFDIGFKFKGKSILFLIDTSYSMTEEDRMGQVKAGIKMLITSLPKEYKIDVIQFPLGERAPFKTMWGDVRGTTQFNRTDAFDFIYRLRPNGGTPTREALLFALKNYSHISDIVLLTDGTPTFHNSNKKDDIYDILRVVRDENKTGIQINTIGVGSDLLLDKTSTSYKFLSLLASENRGFFVGF